jgi:alcohol dehydrogenase (cytochrome c)
MKFLAAIFLALLALAPMAARSFGSGPGAGPGLDPSVLLHPPVDAWPTYNGDYSGRRFSTLTKINDQNVKALSLAWMYELPRNGAAPGGRLAGTPVLWNGVMYITSPDKV